MVSLQRQDLQVLPSVTPFPKATSLCSLSSCIAILSWEHFEDLLEASLGPQCRAQAQA